MINLDSPYKSVVRVGYTTQVLAFPCLRSGRNFMPRCCTVLVWWEEYTLFKEGMYVAMDEYRYSIKKQVDGL